MTRLVRRLLLVVALLLFIAIAPAVVLYAIGYRPPTAENRIAPIGVLLIEAIPRRVNVDVASEPVGRTPRAISNLQPGPVDVRLSKDGYVPWEKTLPIEPARATELRNVRLFPENPEQQLILPRVQLASLAPNRSLLAAVDNSQLFHVLDEEGQSVADPVPLPGVPQYLFWSPDSTYVLVEYESGVFDVVNITSELVTRIRLTALTGHRHVQWDSRIPGRLLALTPDEAIVSYNIANATQSRLIENVDQFAVGPRALYVLSQTQDLNVYSLQGDFMEAINMVPDTQVTQLLPSAADGLAVLLADSRLALLSEDGELEDIATNVSQAEWSLDGNILLLQTGASELQIYNVGNERLFHIPLNQLHLVVRLSRPITHAQWYAGGQHVVYQVDDEIVVTEIDTRDHPISYSVDTTNTGDAQVAVGEDGNVLYYLKRSGEQAALHSAALLTPEDQ